MAVDTIDTFLNSSTRDRFRMALDERLAGELVAYLGPERLDRYIALAQRVTRRSGGKHLGSDPPINLVFVPGVMGSLLQSSTLGGVWWIDARTRGHLNDLRLSPDGHEDANRNYRVVPTTTDPVYEPFLAAVLERDDFGHAIFPYDWRKPLSLSAALLRDQIVDLYQSNGHQRMHLVAHSMGGWWCAKC